MKAKHFIIGGAAIAALLLIFGKRKASFDPNQWLQYATSRVWGSGGKSWEGSKLRLSVLPDGSVTIGDGYRGVLVNENTIVTKERHGQPDREITWSVVG